MILALLLACRPTADAPVGPGRDGPATGRTTAPGGAPNVLLITVDTLRADAIGVGGAPAGRTPAIDALAASGVSFTRAYAPRGATWPSLTTLHTSLEPAQHGVRSNHTVLDHAPLTLAEHLAGRGYTAGAALTNAAQATWEGFHLITPMDPEPDDPTATTAALAWIAEQEAAPWLCWVHLSAPHDPYVNHPQHDWLSREVPGYAGPIDDTQGPLVRAMFNLPAPTEADLRAIRARYASEVSAVDAEVARLVAGVPKDTLIVFTADHGEELYDHPPFLFHFASPWDTVLHVPLIVAGAPGAEAGRRVEELVGLLDVAPTVVESVGGEVPAAWRGRSLGPLLEGGTLPPRPVVSELDAKVLVVHQGRWAYLTNPQGYTPELAPPQQRQLAKVNVWPYQNAYHLPTRGLWDLSADPGQLHDLAAARPEVVSELHEALKAWQAEVRWPGKQAGLAKVPADVAEKLEKLGYVDPAPGGVPGAPAGGPSAGPGGAAAVPQGPPKPPVGPPNPGAPRP